VKATDHGILYIYIILYISCVYNYEGYMLTSTLLKANSYLPWRHALYTSPPTEWAAMGRSSASKASNSPYELGRKDGLRSTVDEMGVLNDKERYPPVN
jgi:hypothetical protein